MSTKALVKTQGKTSAALVSACTPQTAEREPEHVAERPDSAAQLESAARLGHNFDAVSVDSFVPPMIQRQETSEQEEEELQMKREPAAIQRQEIPEEEEEEEVMMKPLIQRVGVEGGPVSAEVEAAIRRARGGGQPLEGALQEQMSASLGHDFSQVRVHADAEADQLNRQVQAKVFTTGWDLFFRQGEYNPGSGGGRELIAHELSHVVQQGTGRASGGGGRMMISPADDAFEQEADAISSWAAHTPVRDLQQRRDGRQPVGRQQTLENTGGRPANWRGRNGAAKLSLPRHVLGDLKARARVLHLLRNPLATNKDDQVQRQDVMIQRNGGDHTLPEDSTFTETRKYAFHPTDRRVLYTKPQLADYPQPREAFPPMESGYIDYSKQFKGKAIQIKLEPEKQAMCDEFAQKIQELAGRQIKTKALGWETEPVDQKGTPEVGKAYVFMPAAAGRTKQKTVETLEDPAQLGAKVRRATTTPYHVTTVVAKDGGDIITCEVNRAFQDISASIRSPWFTLHSGGMAQFFEAFREEYTVITEAGEEKSPEMRVVVTS